MARSPDTPSLTGDLFAASLPLEDGEAPAAGGTGVTAPTAGVEEMALDGGEDFLAAVSRAVLDFIGGGPDLSRLRLVVPGLPLASQLRRELGRTWGLRAPTGVPLLLPPCDTLARWAAGVALTPAPLPPAERLVLLRDALAERGWFEAGSLWGISEEMAGLFDELTTHGVTLPQDEGDFLAQLEGAYALRASQPLAFEVRVVHELWRALAGLGRPDAPAAHALRLATLAKQGTVPLVAVLDGPPADLIPAERAFYRAYGERQPVLLLYPRPRDLSPAQPPLARLLAAAWPRNGAAPEDGDAPLGERGQALAGALATSPLAGRLELQATQGREQEARAAAATVLALLAEGRQHIALIAQDRLVARRVRALLERRQILVADETGWKLSTSRSGATLDALLETVAGGVYHRDLLDLLKSPHLFGDLEDKARKGAVFALEQAIRRAGAKSGLAAMERALEQARQRLTRDGEAGAGTEDRRQALDLAGSLLQRLGQALVLLGGGETTLSAWIDRLERALTLLDARGRLARDTAGQVILSLLEQRRDELADTGSRFPFGVWRDWLNRELEGETFRDRSISSPLVMTHLAAARLRPFDAAVILGGDGDTLRPTEPSAAFFNQGVRRELGLPTREAARERLRLDLALLLQTVPRVVVTWQRERDGEACLLAPELDRLSALHRFAWGDDLQRPPRRLADPPESPEARPGPTTRPAPCLAPDAVPLRLSVSAYASLVACPYRFFARHVLALGELDEVSEEMEKRDYGELVHGVLERFHAQYPVLAQIDDDEALAALQRLTEESFRGAVGENYLSLGWRLRWEKHWQAYLDWQRAWEGEGWRWQQAEQTVSCQLPLPDGASLEFHGRIDRRDAQADDPDCLALLDYKTRSRAALRQGLGEDVQLASYAVLVGEKARQAAYVALDDSKVEAVTAAEDLQGAATANRERLIHSVAALRQGAPLPAHGADRVCAFCEMAGLCRREYC